MIDKRMSAILVQHKQVLAEYHKKPRDSLFTPIIKTADELCIVFANYRCQSCKSEKQLQYHHIVTRHYKRFLPLIDYIIKRHYWSNIIILCAECHDKIHFRELTIYPVCIPQEKIDLLKKKWGENPRKNIFGDVNEQR